jgi:ligand-binding SRPBCC domain-containing protein
VFQHLHFTQFISAKPEEVWAFFATPENLNSLTPPELHFETLSSPGSMYAGQMIAYRIRLLPGIRVHWLTEITHMREGAYFVDEQRQGPYKIWHHEHHFIPKNGGVEMTDHVTYALPFAPFSAPVHRYWVKPILQRIFDFRREKITAHFAPR